MSDVAVWGRQASHRCSCHLNMILSPRSSVIIRWCSLTDRHYVHHSPFVSSVDLFPRVQSTTPSLRDSSQKCLVPPSAPPSRHALRVMLLSVAASMGVGAARARRLALALARLPLLLPSRVRATLPLRQARWEALLLLVLRCSPRCQALLLYPLQVSLALTLPVVLILLATAP